MVFPIVFCYRQFLELQMKHLIRQGRELLELDEDFKMTHDLRMLWPYCRSTLEQVAGSAEPPEDIESALDAVTEGIEQLSSIDPLSEGFRYPEDKKGNPSLPDAIQIFNLRHFGAHVEKLGNLMRGASEQISVYFDDKRDMERECRQ